MVEKIVFIGFRISRAFGGGRGCASLGFFFGSGCCGCVQVADRLSQLRRSMEGRWTEREKREMNDFEMTVFFFSLSLSFLEEKIWVGTKYE